MTKTPKHTPAEVAFIKAELLCRLEQGHKLRPTAATFGVNRRMLEQWRRDDPAFHQAVTAANAAKFTQKHADETAAKIARIKDVLPDRVAGGTVLTHAMKELGVKYDALGHYRRADPEFDQKIKDAQEHLTECELDRAKNLHEEIVDPKMCAVASSNLWRWLEVRNAKFRPKADPVDSQPALVEILRAAVNRLIDLTPAAPAQSLIEHRPTPAQLRYASEAGDDPMAPLTK